MKKYIVFLFAALLTSCNLFIEEEDTVNEEGFKNVPTHTGNGYDEPVTVQEGDAVVTYQYNSNVRVLSPEEQKEWIVKTEMDPTGTCYFIYYRNDTPKDVLPVPGEILVSTPSEKFEWGLNHKVVDSSTRDGAIIIGAIISKIDETFKELQMDGRVSTIEKENYYTAEGDDAVVDLDENGAPIATGEDGESAQARQSTRADDQGSKAYVEYTDDSFFINLPVSKEFELGLPKGIKAKVNTEGSTMTVRNTFDLSGFDLTAGKYNVKLTQTIEEDFKIKLTGGWSGDKRIKRFKPIRGKPIVVSVVVLVLFVNIDIVIEGSVEATFMLTKSLHQTKTYDVNLKAMTVDIREDEKATGDGKTAMDYPKDDGKYHLDNVVIEGEFGIYAKIQVGLGFYGKIISLSVVPKIGAKLSIAMPTYWNSDSETIYDIGDETGITVSFPFSADVGIFWDLDFGLDLDLSAKDLFFSGLTNNPNPFVAVSGIIAKKSLDFWTSLVSGNEADYNATKVDYVNTDDDDGNDDGGESLSLSDGYYHPFGPYYPIKPIHFAWFPTMKKNSFKVLKSWDEENKKLNFKGEFQCAGIGFIGGLGIQFVPALQIYEGNELKDVVWPDEGGKSAVLKEDNIYHFTIANSSEDVTYYARPCYYGRPLGMKQNPDALDKSLPFCAFTPMISITDMKPTYADAVGYDSQGLFIYSFNFDLYTSVKGISNVGSFGLEDLLNEGKFNHTYKPGSDKQMMDGTYVLKYMVHIHSKSTSKQLKMNLRPWLTIPDVTSIQGSPYGFIISTEGWYRSWDAETNKKGTKKKFTNASYTSRQRNNAFDDDDDATGDDDTDDLEEAIREGRVEVIIESVEPVADTPVPQVLI